MTDFSKIFNWAVRILPFSIISGLLIPGDAWIAQEIRTFAGLITVLILPGFALARLLRLFDHFDNWLDVLSLSVALSWGSGLILWLLFFFLSVPLEIVSFVWLGMTLIGLIISAFVPLPRHLTARPSQPWIVIGIVLWIVVITGVAYLYGGQVYGDGWSYATWLRNITNGDVQPGSNIHAGWETDHPFFKNLYSPSLFYYAITSWIGQVDPVWVWTRAQAFWIPILMAVQFSLTYFMFNRRLVGFVSMILAPFLFTRIILHTSSLGGSTALSSYILLPLSLWFLLQVVFLNRGKLYWQMVIAVILGATLAFEHFPHLVYYLLNAGALALLGFFPHRRRSTIFRSGVVITLTIALALPFILLSWNLAKAYGYDTDLALLKKVSGYLRLGGFFIVHPRSLVGGLKGGLRGLFVILSFVFIGRYRQRFWSEDIVRLLIISPALVVFIALNPFLVPVLSRLLAPQTIMRLRQAMVIWVLGSLSYGVTRAGLRIRTHWRHRDRWTVWQLASIVLMALLIIGSATSLTLDAAYVKVKNVVYGPGNATLIPSERVIRRMIEAELEDPPHPILIPPARLAQYLDADILAFIRRNMPADSIFLAERLTECYLPAYADQLAYLGRPGWPGSGDICPRVRNEGAKAAFPLLNKPEVVFERLDVACNILDPNADPDEIETLLIANQSEIDYILVTPNTDYLKGKLDQIMPSARVYTGDGFMIYALSELDGSK